MTDRIYIDINGNAHIVTLPIPPSANDLATYNANGDTTSLDISGLNNNVNAVGNGVNIAQATSHYVAPELNGGLGTLSNVLKPLNVAINYLEFSDPSYGNHSPMVAGIGALFELELR